jgi:hypothetical protein
MNPFGLFNFLLCDICLMGRLLNAEWMVGLPQ